LKDQIRISSDYVERIELDAAYATYVVKRAGFSVEYMSRPQAMMSEHESSGALL